VSQILFTGIVDILKLGEPSLKQELLASKDNLDAFPCEAKMLLAIRGKE